MKLRIKNNLRGEILIPPSKSIIHRALILAALSKDSCRINNIIYSKDVLATISCLENLGIKIVCNDDYIEVIPSKINYQKVLEANESGSTLRFMIPLMLLDSKKKTIDGKNKLKERPLDDYINIFDRKNIKYIYSGKLPLTVEGVIEAGDYHLSGKTSSQFISGLIMALGVINGDSRIIIDDEIESLDYVTMTIELCNYFKGDVKLDNNIIYVKGNRNYSLKEITVESDYSQASFFLVANALGANIKIKGLLDKSLQGDKRVLDYLKDLGFNFTEEFILKEYKEKYAVLDFKNSPDLALPIGVLVGALGLRCKMQNLNRLRYKESDRLKVLLELLDKIGTKYNLDGDCIEIKEVNLNDKVSMSSYNDHRVVMSLAMLALKLDEVEIDDLKPVEKSYPTFFSEYCRLGGEVIE